VINEAMLLKNVRARQSRQHMSAKAVGRGAAAPTVRRKVPRPSSTEPNVLRSNVRSCAGHPGVRTRALGVRNCRHARNWLAVEGSVCPPSRYVGVWGGVVVCVWGSREGQENVMVF